MSAPPRGAAQRVLGYDAYDRPNRGYLTDTISGNYKTAGGALNTSSGLYLHTVDGPATSCIQDDGSTSYSEAPRQAQAELLAHGRPNVPSYIVFLTDGEANMGSVYGPNTAYPQGNELGHAYGHRAGDVLCHSSWRSSPIMAAPSPPPPPIRRLNHLILARPLLVG